ncbi:hypothetical protein IFM89_013922 [Coptis chinensis]|uniref:MaoC-like domain-containing protein n=1 Tax=Coptis chinensis TaxID=261450 RepID=A0A835LMG4_9MAGN|nr:hypothetical protein IFM89_013922 [Coptis chinensis]
MSLKRLSSVLVPTSSFSTSHYSFKIGHVLNKSRSFTDSDLLDYAKLTQDSNPLHFDSEFAQRYGYNDRIVHGIIIATLFPQIIASHFMLRRRCRGVPSETSAVI